MAVKVAIDTKALSEVPVDTVPRLPTGLAEFDRVLGGGMVPGSVVLIGGDPGIGKPGNPIRGPDHLIRKLRGGTLDAAANARALGGPQILSCPSS